MVERDHAGWRHLRDAPMKNKTLILLGLAVVCGLLASFMTSRLLSQRNAQPVDEDEKVTLLVAKQKLTYGLRLDVPENYLEPKDFPVDQVPQGAIHNVEEARGKMVSVNYLAPGTAIVKDHLLDSGSVGYGGKMTQGKRAFAIRTNAASSAGGLILPGSHVDVMLTTKDEARVILSDIMVCAVDTHVKTDPNSPMVGQTVTLEVDPPQAALLNLAGRQGDLSLSLRALGDKVDTIGTVVTVGDVSKVASSSTKSGSVIGGVDPTQPKVLPIEPNFIGKTEPTKTEDEVPAVKKRKAFKQELYNGPELIVTYFDDETGKRILDDDKGLYDLPKSK
jgi:pilus assembly protein CpaB